MNTSAQKPALNGDRLKITEYIGYALGDTASNFFFQMFNIFLVYYYVDVWGIEAAKVALMMVIVRLFDAFCDPVMGLIADRTNTRWGKFRPYILFGAIPYGICGYMMFAGPDFSENGKLAYAYITYTLMLLSYTVINVPYSSLMGVLSPSSRTRTVASSFRFVGAFTGGFLISLFVRPLVKYLGGDNETLGFQMTMAIFAVVSVVMFWITFGTTKERVKPLRGQKSNVWEELGELFRNWPWIMLLIASIFSTSFIALRSGSTVFYFKYVAGDNPISFHIPKIFLLVALIAAAFLIIWRYDKKNLLHTIAITSILMFFIYLNLPTNGVNTNSKFFNLELDRTTIFLSTGMLAQIAGTVALGFLARRVDKKYAAVFLCAVTGLCFLTFYFLPKEQFILLVLVNALGYLCMGPTSALTWALYGDVADYGEWKFGRRSTGLVFSASLFAIKTGVTVGGFLLPWFLAYFSYKKPPEGMAYIEQSRRAILGITLAFSIVPGIIALLKAAAIMIYPLNQKRVSEIEQVLAQRRAEASTGKENA